MANIKKIIAGLLCAAALCSAGCKENENLQNGIQEPISKIALITDVIELEEDFHTAAVWQGITTCGDANNIEYARYRPEQATVDAICAQFDSAVAEGAKVIVCKGTLFSGALAKMQEKYPDIKFIAIDVPEASIGQLAENTHCVLFRQEQAGYMAGYAAVKDGFTKLGFLGEFEAENYSNYGYGFVQGASDAAAQTNTHIDLTFSYASDYSSTEDALAQLDAWYAAGTEIVMVSANDSFVKSAAELAVKNFRYIIGTNIDQSYLGSNFDYNPFMTSAMKGITEAVDATLEMVLAGNWKSHLGGQTIRFGLQNGNYLYLPESEGLWLFEAFTLEDYTNLKGNLSSGSITVNNTMPKVDQELINILLPNEAE
jgi:bmp family protein